MLSWVTVYLPPPPLGNVVSVQLVCSFHAFFCSSQKPIAAGIQGARVCSGYEIVAEVAGMPLISCLEPLRHIVNLKQPLSLSLSLSLFPCFARPVVVPSPNAKSSKGKYNHKSIGVFTRRGRGEGEKIKSSFPLLPLPPAPMHLLRFFFFFFLAQLQFNAKFW